MVGFTPTTFTFRAYSPHPESGGYIKFRIYNSGGRMYLRMQAEGPDGWIPGGISNLRGTIAYRYWLRMAYKIWDYRRRL